MSGEDIAPEHDPLAEEMDLLTFQEADARLYEERARTRVLIEELESSASPDHEEIADQRNRLAALDRVMERLRGQRTKPQPR